MTISPVYHGAPADARTEVEQRTYALLERLQIPFDRVDHDTASTMDDCAVVSKVLGVPICKNLLLTPRNRSAFYLLCMPADKPFITRDFSRQIGSSRLSFATAEDLEELLGVQVGSASVLALMNDPENRVRLLMDEQVRSRAYFGCHPCENTSSLRLRMSDLVDVILPALHHTPTYVTL